MLHFVVFHLGVYFGPGDFHFDWVHESCYAVYWELPDFAKHQIVFGNWIHRQVPLNPIAENYTSIVQVPLLFSFAKDVFCFPSISAWLIWMMSPCSFVSLPMIFYLSLLHTIFSSPTWLISDGEKVRVVLRFLSKYSIGFNFYTWNRLPIFEWPNTTSSNYYSL